MLQGVDIDLSRLQNTTLSTLCKRYVICKYVHGTHEVTIYKEQLDCNYHNELEKLCNRIIEVLIEQQEITFDTWTDLANKQHKLVDDMIDRDYDKILLFGKKIYASEVMFAVDKESYTQYVYAFIESLLIDKLDTLAEQGKIVISIDNDTRLKIYFGDRVEW